LEKGVGKTACFPVVEKQRANGERQKPKVLRSDEVFHAEERQKRGFPKSWGVTDAIRISWSSDLTISFTVISYTVFEFRQVVSVLPFRSYL
jgi:hypothetical protein